MNATITALGAVVAVGLAPNVVAAAANIALRQAVLQASNAALSWFIVRRLLVYSYLRLILLLLFDQWGG